MFTVPSGVDGIYYFSTFVRVDDGKNQRFDMRLNDDIICTTRPDHNNNGAADYASGSCSAVVDVVAGGVFFPIMYTENRQKGRGYPNQVTLSYTFCPTPAPFSSPLSCIRCGTRAVLLKLVFITSGINLELLKMKYSSFSGDEVGVWFGDGTDSTPLYVASGVLHNGFNGFRI